MFQLLSTLGVVGGGVGALLFALEQSVQASGSEAHASAMPWSHNGWFASMDHARYLLFVTWNCSLAEYKDPPMMALFLFKKKAYLCISFFLSYFIFCDMCICI